jgi:pseudouridine synthase
VAVDGQIVFDLGRRIDPAHSVLTLDGQPLEIPLRFEVYAFHKPLGVVSTLKAQGGQASLLPFRTQAGLPARFKPVGRLDLETTGLLLWTDDGDLNQALCRPRSSIWKTYEVELNRPLATEQLPILSDGEISLDGRPCLPCRIQPAAGGASGRHWTLKLHEGRNRQVRRMFQALGLQVVRLHRSSFGPIRLGQLDSGGFRRLSSEEEQALQRAGTQPDQEG